MKRDEFLQVIRSPFHFATCDAVLRGCKIVDISKPPQWRRMSKKVRSPLDPLCEGTPPAGGGGENCAVARNILGYGKVLSLRPFGAPPSQREVFRHAELPPRGKPLEFSLALHPQCGIFFCIFEKNREKLLDIGENVGYNNIAFSRARRQMWRYSSVG